MQIYGWKYVLEVSHHICESGYIFLCLKAYVTLWLEAMLVAIGRVQASGDLKYLICHVTSPNHMIDGSCNFVIGNSSLYVLQDLVINGLSNFMSRSQSR